MKDKFGRGVTGLRVSVTEDCNLNCFYCHREGCPVSSREMTAEEIGKIVELAAEFGVRKIKLTGGEPLLRKDIVEVVGAAVKPKINDVSMTVNGTLLDGLARELSDAGLTRVNISLDTLNEERYEKITGKKMLDDTLGGIDAAIEAGLQPVKLNMVLLRGVNEHEVESMMTYASKRGVILQLIELLDLNGADYAAHHCGLDDVEQKLQTRATAVRTRRSMQARKKYILPEGEVEIVKPMHNTKFCAHCTRLRLTPDGHLKPCLMRNDDLVDLLTHVRSGNEDGARDAFLEAIARREPYFKIPKGANSPA